MKKRENYKEIFERIEFLAIILIIWSLLTTLFPLENYLGKTFASVLGIVITLGAFGYLGFSIKKENKDERYAAKLGAYLGAIVGLAGAIIGIISFYLFPERIEQVIQQAISQGADANLVRKMTKISIYFSLIFSPAISAAFGSLISWVFSLGPRKK